MSKARLLRSESGLTLVEIIVVLVILSIVMGFLMSRIMGQGDKAKRKISEMKISALEGAIEEFRLSYNKVPLALEDLIQCSDITGPGCVPPLRDEEALNDGWGNRFLYSTENNGRTYRISSLGADGREGGSDINSDFHKTGP